VYGTCVVTKLILFRTAVVMLLKKVVDCFYGLVEISYRTSIVGQVSPGQSSRCVRLGIPGLDLYRTAGIPDRAAVITERGKSVSSGAICRGVAGGRAR